MTRKSDTVRFSRAGDQFHYRWAARKCLSLLDPSSGLVCITIEGISSKETEVDNNESGEEVVDVAEYFGDSSIGLATKISYHQLKHSYKEDKPWTLSALSSTLEGFFKRYIAFKAEAKDLDKQCVEFTYTTNRPGAVDTHELIERIKNASIEDKDEKHWSQIKGYLNTEDDSLAYEFFSNFRIDDANDRHWIQRNILIEELSGYIAGPDKEAADQLWRLVSDKVMPEYANTPEITREDVLRYLNTDEGELFPAPCLIEQGDEHFRREQEDIFLQNILMNDGRPIIIHAESGVGKTALASRLKGRVPSDSVSFLYDCFGNGEYRNPVRLRHPHHVGLVQIANELASLKLCHPLIPSPYAQPSHYLKAFIYRLEQAAKLLRGQNPDAKLVIFVDAADNAEMAAEERNERTSFARDLIRQKLPEGVVLVFLCRSHRIEKLDPPVEYVDLLLSAFSEAETEKLIKQKFPDATLNDVREFHRLSSQNPRLQATALERGLSLPKTLSMLGPNPTTVEDAIKGIFEQAIKQLLDAVPRAEAVQIQALCESLAALRPFIPIKVLALASGMDESAIKSFLLDLGRPLSITGDAVQFFDEPSETWFRENYKPTKAKLAKFINAIRPLAREISYVASALPQLMLEAGQYEELLELVLEDAELPDENPVDRRNASLQSLQFALKAALRMKRYDDAAKLALKAGGETAGNDRQQALLQKNTDLVSQLLPDHRLREIVAQKTFSTSWHGGHHSYEASLLSGCPETLPESRSYLRLAYKWVNNWSNLSKEDRKNTKISDHDIAEMTLCQFYLNGAEVFVRELERWSPKNVAYRVSLIVFQKLVDLGKFGLLDEVATHSVGNLSILLSLINAQNAILRYPSAEVVKKALDGLKKYPRQIRKSQVGPPYEEPLLSVVNSVVQAAIAHKTNPHNEIADILDLYIPEPEKYYFSRYSGEPRFTLLRANCMRAALRGETIEFSDLAKPKIKEQLEKESHYQDRDTQEFLEDIGAALPWHKLWICALLGQVEAKKIDVEIEQCLSTSKSAVRFYNRDARSKSKEISRLWMEILLLSDPTTQRMEKFLAWKDSLEQRLFIPALTRLTKLCACTETYKDYSYTFAQEAFDIIDQERMDAEEKVESYINISRAVYALETREALHYFDKAIEVAGQIGQENLDRWSSLLELSFTASEPDIPKPELSYRLSRAAEVVYDFVARDKHFDWGETIEGITRLCPASSLAILSRWKDRSFCWASREFPRAVKKLMELEKLSPDSALALIGYQCDWSEIELLQSAIAYVKDDQMQRRLFDHALRYIEIRGMASKDWELIVELISQKGWDGYAFEGYLLQSNQSEKLKERRNNGPIGNYKPEPDPPKDWDAIFHELDSSSAESIQASYRNFRQGKPPFYTEQFAVQFFQRVPQGSESDALEAIFSVSDFNLYSLRDVYEAIPEKWVSRNYIRSTLSGITRTVCKTHFYSIAKSRYYQPLPYEVITRCSGVTEQQIYQWVIEASAENPLILGSGRLFSLVGLISPALTPQQAADTLDYGLKLLEKDMNDSDGDGDWSLALLPPTEVNISLAGYIWTSLASPQTSERWEAAHVVCLLCSFEKNEILMHLLSFATGKDPSPYHDSTLPFYDLSAKLWLLVALRRAFKLGYSKAVLLFMEFLCESCSKTERHIMLRGISACILLELNQNKDIELSEAEAKRLSKINESKQKVVESKTYRREFTAPTPAPETEEEKYFFGIDIPRYWFENLGEMFAFNSKEIEHRALKIIRAEWGVLGRGGWSGDPRHLRKLYGENEYRHSHGSYPDAEDLSFYYSYHAMMMVAGDLIDTAQRYQSSDYSDELEEWIKNHQLTRSDGLWLADRRDPKPTEIPEWKSEKEIDNWPYSITKDELLSAFVFGEQRICVWGEWNSSEGDREERVHVSSAFVNVEHAYSLMRALQTTLSPYDYGIPSSGSDLEIDSEPYQLKGWIRGSSREHRIDKRDPWAGDIVYPPIRPAKWFSKKKDLQSDYECRLWHSSAPDCSPVLTSYVWGRKSGKNEYTSPETGSRLLADVEALKTWLSSINMDLIIEVQINRDFRRDSYHYRQKKTEEYLLPYTLIAIFKANGKIKTL
ncbi:ATP-binding protein [bacterium]|nr:ATP-binding protein [bacterium]